MNHRWRNPFFFFGLVLLWRLALLIFTAQPIPANDSFFYDGAVAHWLEHGHYFNPAIADLFPISGGEVFSSYPPGYQAVLLPWMWLFGASVISAMALHLTLFALAGFLVLKIVEKKFPATTNYSLIVLLFLGVTFGDRPEDLAHIFGLGSLLLTMQLGAANHWKTAAGLIILLLLALFTSPVCAAFYFGAGFLTAAMTWPAQRKTIVFLPFLTATVLFFLITFGIVKLEPLWWQGFMETARQQSVVTVGLHAPSGAGLLKLIRTVPVFLVALGLLPALWRNGPHIFATAPLRLALGIFVAGWGLFAASLTLLSPIYVGYALFAQVLLAAGILALVENKMPANLRLWRWLLLGCALLMSIRAVGLSTWGAACAWKNSYGQTQAALRAELKPFVATNTPVFISSAFLYDAEKTGVQRAIYCDWYFNHATWTNSSQLNGLIRFKPAKLVLTQFDYYRAFVPVIAELRQQPGLVEVRVHDLARVRPPDAIPALARLVQHISWAPVIVDLDWK